jgi:glutamine amidotransferase
MCRLVGIVAADVTEFGLVLKEAPRSLARLSREHPDGWGIAAHGGRGSIPPTCSESVRRDGEWRVYKGTARAADCRHFEAVASRSAGTVLIAHVRQKTVGPTRLENTHPFLRDGWVFAHNGTIQDQTWIRANTSAARLAEVQGDTDSEVLFAHLLTRLDAVGTTLASSEAREEATRVLARATEELRARAVGAFNFLLSDGVSCFVHRFGRTLFLLERTPGRAPDRREDESGTRLKEWTARRPAVLVASERLTDERWHEVPEGTFFRVDRTPTPTIAWTDAAAPERAAS